MSEGGSFFSGREGGGVICFLTVARVVFSLSGQEGGGSFFGQSRVGVIFLPRPEKTQPPSNKY